MLPTTQQMSPEGVRIILAFQAAWLALAEHAKAFGIEASFIADFCAAHLRNSYPMAVAQVPDPVLERGEL